MTSKQPPLIVADTSILVSILKKEEHRVAASQAFLEGHGGSHLVVLPAVAELELFAEADLRHASSIIREERQAASRRIESYLNSQRFVSGDLSPRAVRFARVRIADLNIRFADAAIVGTALALNAIAVYTWDDKLIRACSDLEGIEVTNPPAPESASETPPLFDAPTP